MHHFWRARGLLSALSLAAKMSYISVKEASEKWGITERVVRQYCADGRIPGAFHGI